MQLLLLLKGNQKQSKSKPTTLTRINKVVKQTDPNIQSILLKIIPLPIEKAAAAKAVASDFTFFI